MRSTTLLGSAWRAAVVAERIAVDAAMGLGMAIIPLMAIAITFEVIARRVFSAPTIWVVDASGFALLWLAFLTAPWLVRHDSHIQITFVVDRMGPRARAVVAIATLLIGAAVVAVVLWLTTMSTIDSSIRHVRTIGTWEIPQAAVWVVMPVGSLLTFIEFLRSAWLRAAQLRAGAPPPPTPAELGIPTDQVT